MDIVGRHPDQYTVYALVAGNNVALLSEQIVRFRPEVAVTATEQSRQNLIDRLTG